MEEIDMSTILLRYTPLQREYGRRRSRMMQCAELARDTGGRRIVKIPGKQLQSQKTFLAF
eukprot:scaffold140_cov259-Chaetoceros_neogracile.AAC.9